MSMYNLIEYRNNYSKTSGSLWQYCKEIPAVNNASNIVDFDGANATDSFNFKAKITGKTNDGGRLNVEIMVPLKYISNFWRILEMPLINCEVELFSHVGCRLCYKLHRCCESKYYIYNNRDKYLCSCSYFIKLR